MYPERNNFFLKQCEEAVRRPYGYLLIDLKTTTQDNKRAPQRRTILSSRDGRKYPSGVTEISETAKSFDRPRHFFQPCSGYKAE